MSASDYQLDLDNATEPYVDVVLLLTACSFTLLVGIIIGFCVEVLFRKQSFFTGATGSSTKIDGVQESWSSSVHERTQSGSVLKEQYINRGTQLGVVSGSKTLSTKPSKVPKHIAVIMDRNRRFGRQKHNDNDALSGSEDGELAACSGSKSSSSSGYSSDSSDNSLASHSNRTHSTHSTHTTHRYSSGRDSVEGDYYLGSDDEEEVGDDDQGSTCSATGSDYLDDYGAGEGGVYGDGEGSDGSDYGGGSGYVGSSVSSGGSNNGGDGYDEGEGSDCSSYGGGDGNAEYANDITSYSSSSTHNTTRRSDSNSSVTNSSDDEGSDFEDMMNRRRLSIDSASVSSTGTSTGGGSNGSSSGTSSASGNTGTIVETEEDDPYYA